MNPHATDRGASVKGTHARPRVTFPRKWMRSYGKFGGDARSGARQFSENINEISKQSLYKTLSNLSHSLVIMAWRVAVKGA
jgi:hypothetical protein